MMLKYSTIIVMIILFAFGCSNISNVERADLTDSNSRLEYVSSHPAGTYNEYISSGEITVGMNVNEVAASWGLPNVYIVSEENDMEFWVYYIQDETPDAIMVYTLTFDKEGLSGWDIDIKRFSGNRIVFKEGKATELTVKKESKIIKE